MEVYTDLKRWYEYALDQTDERSRSWPLVDSPMIPLVSIAAYLGVVRYGPYLMKDRQPFKLQWLLVLYNFSLVLLSAYMMFEFLMASIEARYSLTCQMVDYSYKPSALRMLFACWLYYFSKYIELADTVFFILRKKTSQISVLHVYHHAATVFVCWVGLSYVPGGQNFLQPLLNSGVHVVMYTYYGMAAVGPSVHKYLWWKKYLTTMQLIQLSLIMCHTGYNTLTDCAFPKSYNLLIFCYALSLLLLFANFYLHTYSRKPEVRGKSCTTSEPEVRRTSLTNNGANENGVYSRKNHKE